MTARRKGGISGIVLFTNPRCRLLPMAYRLNLYREGKLTRTELVHGPLQEVKELAVTALDRHQAHRAELVDESGSIIFHRWAVL